MSTPNQEPPRTRPAQQPEAGRRRADQPARRSRRRGCLLTGCGTILALLLLLLGVAAYLGTRSESFTEDVSASLKIVEGSAELRRSGGNWERAVDMATLAPGDAVRIGDGSVVFINYFDGSTTRLNDRSEFELLKSSRAVSKPGMLSPLMARLRGEKQVPRLEVDTDISARLILGKSLTRVEKLGSTASSFQFQTPNSVAGVTGTIFEAVVDAVTGETTWQVAEGTVQGMAIVVDEVTGQITGVLMPLAENDKVSVKKLPDTVKLADGREVRVTEDATRLLEAAADIVKEVVREVRESIEAALQATPTAVPPGFTPVATATRVPGATAVPTAAISTLVAMKLQQLQDRLLGTTTDQQTGQQRSVFALGMAVGLAPPREAERKEIAQTIARKVTETVQQTTVDAKKNSISNPGTVISDDWLDEWKKPGREIMILNAGEIEAKATEVANKYLNVGQVKVDISSASYVLVTIEKDPVTRNPVVFTLGYSSKGGRLEISGIPGWVQPEWYEGYMKNLKKILIIKPEKARGKGHGQGGALLPSPLTSDQLVVVLENW